MVSDAKGGVLPGANVVALHVASGRRSERQSDSEGRFTLPALPVGGYQVFVELSGFKRFEQHGLTLNVGQKVDLSIVLVIGQLSEAITVTADAPLLRTSNPEIAEIIDNRQMQALPSTDASSSTWPSSPTVSRFLQAERAAPRSDRRAVAQRVRPEAATTSTSSTG